MLQGYWKNNLGTVLEVIDNKCITANNDFEILEYEDQFEMNGWTLMKNSATIIWSDGAEDIIWIRKVS